MALCLNKPSYPFKPITNVAALARALGLEEAALISAAERADRSYRSVPPKKISRDILQLGIAWKIQESRLGGLSVSIKRQIAGLARTMEAKSGLAKPRAVSPKPGVRFLRAWEGVTHEVMVVEDGFLWAGKTWASLSAIAREMTGTRWSGPRFFGLIATTESNASEQKAKASDHE